MSAGYDLKTSAYVIIASMIGSIVGSICQSQLLEKSKAYYKIININSFLSFVTSTVLVVLI